MIIVSTYPNLSGQIDSGSLLQQLQQTLEKLLPSDVIVHLLPPYPASGDGGFAADDWFSTRAGLGCWRDVANWASNRELILDGIYNHVGFAHPWVKDFFFGSKRRRSYLCIRLGQQRRSLVETRVVPAIPASVIRKVTNHRPS